MPRVTRHGYGDIVGGEEQAEAYWHTSTGEGELKVMEGESEAGSESQTLCRRRGCRGKYRYR